MRTVAPGILCLGKHCTLGIDRNTAYRSFILLFTFTCYTSFHLSRKPISVVKNQLHRNCSSAQKFDNGTDCDWAPFNKENYEELLGALDYAFLFSYAIGMFVTGHVAERMNLRYFLSGGMILSAIFTVLFGMGYFWNVHFFTFFLAIQIVGGFFQSTGWPSVVTCVGNWFGKGKRGFIMGVWNAHTSVGNILGSVIAAAFVETAWGWSFVVPGIILGVMGVAVFLFLVPHPLDVDCSLPDHHGGEDIHSYAAIPSEEDDPLVSSERNPTYKDAARAEVEQEKAITIWGALKVPGVIEFSICLFFAKLVSYTFLFWLPKYIAASEHVNPQHAGDLSTVFDFGGIFGGIVAGVISDITGGRATVCMVQLTLAAPMLYVYNQFGTVNEYAGIVMLFICGALVNGPYALITTAVSADLGTHRSLKGNNKALATVTAIIDGTGSMGAALGPLLTGLISHGGGESAWQNVFYMLIIADLLALVMLGRLVLKEFRNWCNCGRRAVEL